MLDEAEKMLQEGFEEELQQILSLLPRKRQTLLFSATFAADVQRLATALLAEPLRIEIAKAPVATELITQLIYTVAPERKAAARTAMADSRDLIARWHGRGRARYAITEVIYNCPRCGGLLEAAYPAVDHAPAAGPESVPEVFHGGAQADGDLGEIELIGEGQCRFLEDDDIGVFHGVWRSGLLGLWLYPGLVIAKAAIGDGNSAV